MSMSVGLFFRGEIPDTAALTQALQELGFPISVIPPHYPLQGQSGYVPMLLRGEESGAEFYIDEGRDGIEEWLADYPELLAKVDPSFDRTASFVFGSRWDEFICGTCAAAALAKLVDGIFFEDQEPVVLPVDEAIQYAREALEQDPPARTSTLDPDEVVRDVVEQLRKEYAPTPIERLQRFIRRLWRA
jgi:hypothetical protein